MIRVVGEDGGFGGRILAFRQKIETVYRRFLPEPQASLVSGLVLGSKSSMPANFYQNLVQTGTVHMVVASGMNVVIVGNILLALLLLWVKRGLATVLSLLGIWFYVLLAGAETPVLRAGVMGSLTFLAQGLGREADAWRGLFLAGIAILLINPLGLFDFGFQLSFAATAGLLFFSPKISRSLQRVPGIVRTSLSQTLGAQIATLPLILFVFGQYSFFSPLTNLLVVPVLPWVMELGMLVAIVGLLSGFLGQIFAWFLLPFLTYFVAVVNLFARI